jgi:cytochrome oxidase Cu insertion factor (SCO1/SenC/PrrC family)
VSLMTRIRVWTAGFAATSLVAALGACGGGPPGPPAASAGTAEDRAVPASIAELPLTDQAGRTVTLAGFRGRAVVVAPFLTLCQEICPMTTANLAVVDRDLAADHVAERVAVVEVSVDPGRDSPARLAAYAHMTGATHELVTESPQVLSRLARFFGWYYAIVPEDSPPATDWWTGRLLTYDVDHSDGFVVLDAAGAQRFSTGATPSYSGRLNPRLAAFLDAQGRQKLAHPEAGAWTPTTVLGALGWLLGRPLPTP